MKGKLDLDHYAVGDHNCLTIPFDDLLANGFSTRQVDIRPAKSVSTALQLMAVIFQIQSLQQFRRRCSFSYRLDTRPVRENVVLEAL